jgi:hypothetical protein
MRSDIYSKVWIGMSVFEYGEAGGPTFMRLQIAIPPDITTRSALELVTKLCDADFARRAKATDFRSRAWDALRGSGAGEGDKVLDAILVLFAALVSQSHHEVTELTQKADFVSVLWEILATLNVADPLELLGSGASEGELKMVGVGKAEKLTVSLSPSTTSTLLRLNSPFS